MYFAENPKESTKKLPKLINDYSKLAGYKVNCFLIYQPMNNWDLKYKTQHHVH